MTPNDDDEGEEDEEDDSSESKELRPRKKKVRQPSEREIVKEHVNMVFIGHVGKRWLHSWVFAGVRPSEMGD